MSAQISGARRALLLHHDPASDGGEVGERLHERGYRLTDHQVDMRDAGPAAREPIPDVRRFDVVVALGGAPSLAGPTREQPWVQDVTATLRIAASHDIPVLGICLGGQLLTLALGGDVHAADQPEFGWTPVSSVQFSVLAGEWFQWHYDWLRPPEGATLVAGTPEHPQAFISGRSLGLQFHPEVTPQIVAAKLRGGGDVEMQARGLDPAKMLAQTQSHQHSNAERARRLVDAWLDPGWGDEGNASPSIHGNSLVDRP